MKLKNKGEDFLVLLGTLGASFLGNIFRGKGINRGGEGVIRAVYWPNSQSKKKKYYFPCPFLD